MTEDQSCPLMNQLRDSIRKYAAAQGMTWTEAVDEYQRLADYVHELFRAFIEDKEPLPMWLAAAVEQAETEWTPRPGQLD